MNVRSLRLQRFRRFEERSIDLDSRITLLVGRNGRGGTTVLDAIAAALGGVVEALGVPSRAVLPTDVRRGSPPDEDGDPPRASLTCRARVDGADCAWTRTSGPGAQPATLLRVEDGVALPIFAYHGGAPRAVPPAPPPSPRLAVYVGCFEIGDPEPAVVASLATLVGTGDPALTAVEDALTIAIGDSDPVALSVADGELQIAVGRAAPIPFAEIGGASRRIACLVADLVLRACTVNPHLGRAAPSTTPGVVLVEHLDAGLHPRWQRYLLDDLRSIFPRVQIVATSASPFLLQALHAGGYVDLDGRGPAMPSRMSVEDIAEEILGVRVPQRSKRFQDMQKAATEIMTLIRAGAPDPAQKELLKARLDEKMMPFSNDPAWTAVMRLERVAAGLADPLPEDEDDDEVIS
jgi:hypothetical protein